MDPFNWRWEAFDPAELQHEKPTFCHEAPCLASGLCFLAQEVPGHKAALFKITFSFASQSHMLSP